MSAPETNPSPDTGTETAVVRPRTAARKAGLMSNIGVGTRIVIMAALPLLAVAYFGQQAVVEDISVLRDSDRTGMTTRFAGTVGNVTHEMQVERNLTAQFIASKGKKFASALSGQRMKADAALQKLETQVAAHSEQLSKSEIDKLQAVVGARVPLSEHRTKVDALGLDPAAAAKFYSGRIAANIHVIKDLAKTTNNSTVIRHTVPFLSILQTKEYARQERAVAALGVSEGNFPPQAVNRFITLVASQNQLLATFSESAPAELVSAGKEALSGDASTKLAVMRTKILEGIDSGLFDGVSAAELSTVSSRRIAHLRTLEDRSLSSLITLVDKFGEDAADDLRMLILRLAVLLAVMGSLGFFIVRSISAPVKRLTEITEKLTDGELDTEIDIPEGRDEIGRLVKQVKIFKDNLVAVGKMQADQADAAKAAFEMEKRAEIEKRAAEEKAAEERRRLEAEAAETRRQDMLELADSFEASVGGIIEAVSSAATELQSSSQAMAAAAGQTSSQSSTAAAATEEASANVQTVAAAAEELSSSIDEISRQVSKSSDVAQNAVDHARTTNEKVQGLSVAAKKIGEVVDLINDIASQTNLLALNATIEAARAGEAGKGFAVVATEVKSLADQTAKATDEIGGQIAEIQSATNEAVGAIGGITEVISEISEISSSIATAVEEQGASTREISSNVQQAAQGTQEVSANMAQVTQAADQTGDAAGRVNVSADELSVQARNLRSSVDSFLETVRAA